MLPTQPARSLGANKSFMSSFECRTEKAKISILHQEFLRLKKLKGNYESNILDSPIYVNSIVQLLPEIMRSSSVDEKSEFLATIIQSKQNISLLRPLVMKCSEFLPITLEHIVLMLQGENVKPYMLLKLSRLISAIAAIGFDHAKYVRSVLSKKNMLSFICLNLSIQPIGDLLEYLDTEIFTSGSLFSCWHLKEISEISVEKLFLEINGKYLPQVLDLACTGTQNLKLYHHAEYCKVVCRQLGIILHLKSTKSMVSPLLSALTPIIEAVSKEKNYISEPILRRISILLLVCLSVLHRNHRVCNSSKNSSDKSNTGGISSASTAATPLAALSEEDKMISKEISSTIFAVLGKLRSNTTMPIPHSFSPPPFVTSSFSFSFLSAIASDLSGAVRRIALAEFGMTSLRDKQDFLAPEDITLAVKELRSSMRNSADPLVRFEGRQEMVNQVRFRLCSFRYSWIRS